MNYPDLNSPTNAVELVRMSDRHPWHVVTWIDDLNRRYAPCIPEAPFYNSADGLKASRADIRCFLLNVCPTCRDRILEVRNAEG